MLRSTDKATGLTSTQLRLLASSLTELCLCHEAQLTFQRIPNITKNPRASQDYALNLLRMGEPAKARKILQAALENFPGDSRLMLQEGLLGLKFGIDEVSRKNYFQRHLVNKTAPLPSDIAPLWWDSELSGKHILLWGEQGIGDELIFFLVLKILMQAKVRCSRACEKRLMPLLSHNFDNLEVIVDRHDPKISDKLENICDIDLQARVGDLWRLVEINRDALKRSPWISAPDGLIEKHKATFPKLNSKKTIGIAWYSKEQRNSVPNSFLDRLYKQIPANWLNLQHSAGEQIRFGPNLVHAHAETQDKFTADDNFCAYAVSILSTDLVITNDTTAGVFATMLGKATVVLCPNDPFWFWDAIRRLGIYQNTTVLRRNWDQSWDDFYSETLVPWFQEHGKAFLGD